VNVTSGGRWLVFCLAGVVALAGCGGGSPAVSPVLPVAGAPAVPATQRLADAKHLHRGKADIVIRLPLHAKQRRGRTLPKYVSPSTQSMTVGILNQPLQTFNLTPHSADCAANAKSGYLTCSLEVFAPVGAQALTIALFDGLNGTGHKLSTATASVTIKAGRLVTVPITLNAVVSSVIVLLGEPGSGGLTIAPGVAATIAVTVNAYDGAGNLIIAPGNYTAPIALSDSDRSGTTKLSATSVTAPGATISLAYNGGALTQATVTPSILSGFPDTAGAAKLFANAAAAMTEFQIPTQGAFPFGIARGSDGAMWFTETRTNKIGRIVNGQPAKDFPISPSANIPEFIAAGPDGALWFTVRGTAMIGRMSTTGAVKTYLLPEAPLAGDFAFPFGITAGPDGALWFTEQYGTTAKAVVGKIGRITTSGAIALYTIPAAGSDPGVIVTGPDGALWFADTGTNSIGRITTSGSITEYSVPFDDANFPSAPVGIAVGPDGALWFTEFYQNDIGRITTGGVVTQFVNPMGGGSPAGGIVAGPDGAMWFAEQEANTIGRITTGGTITNYTVPTTQSNPTDIAVGSDGALWFTEQSTNEIGRIPVSLAAARRI
jgi:virginiamycin B lyase